MILFKHRGENKKRELENDRHMEQLDERIERVETEMRALRAYVQGQPDLKKVVG